LVGQPSCRVVSEVRLLVPAIHSQEGTGQSPHRTLSVPKKVRDHTQ
jgi:hypothetical protein